MPAPTGRRRIPGLIIVALALVPALAFAQTAAPTDPGAALKARLADRDMDGAIDEHDRLRWAKVDEGTLGLTVGERLRLAQGLSDQGRWEEAILQVLRARQLHASARPQPADDLWEARRILARVHAERGSLSRAAETLGPCARPASGVTVPPAEQRSCLMALAGVFAQAGTFARAEEAVDLLLKDARASEHAGLLLLKGLLLDAQGNTRGAAAFFRDHHASAGSHVLMAAYYAGFTPDVPAALGPALEALLRTRVAEEPFFTRWALAVLHRRAAGGDDRDLVLAAVDGIAEPKDEPDLLENRTIAGALRRMMRSLENRIVDAFLASIERAPQLADLFAAPTLTARAVTPGPAQRPFTQLQVGLSAARGVRRLVIRSKDDEFVQAVAASTFRSHRTARGAVELLVTAPLASGANEFSVVAEMTRGTPLETRATIEYRPPEPRVHVLVASVERYGTDRARFVATATADALRLARAFRNLGDSPVAVDLLLNDQVTKSAIKEWALRSRSPDAVVVVVLRGAEAVVMSADRPDMAFVPGNGSLGDPGTLVGARELLGWLSEAKISNALVLLNAESMQTASEAMQRFFSIAGLLWAPRTIAAGPAVVSSQLPLFSARISPEHGQSVFTLALLEALNGLLYRDPDKWAGRLFNVDLVGHLRAYLQREPVIRAFSLEAGHRVFEYQQSKAVFPIIDQTDLRAVLVAARRLRADPDHHLARLARTALRACRSTSRNDHWHARLAFLATLLRAYPGDAPRAFREWSAGD